MSFNNKVVLITGAGSGIGAATAIAFAKQSAKLSLIDIVEDDLNKTIELCKNEGGDVLKVVADLTSDENLKHIVYDTLEKFGKLDVLINCAGIYDSAGILDDNLMDRFDKIISVNVRSLISLTNIAAPALIEAKGCIVNVCVVTKLTTKQNVAYSVPKAAILHFTRCAALELADKGVRVNSVTPGVFKTKLLLNAGVSESVIDAGLDFVAKSTPLKRLVEPAEVADVIIFLSSDNARSVTGSDYEIDGGMLLSGLRS